MLRWLLVAAGSIAAAYAIYAHRDSRAPLVVSDEDWQLGRLPIVPALLQVPGRLSTSGALYNLRPNLNIRERPERLSRRSTYEGIPLIGPDGIPAEERAGFVGTPVQITAGVSHNDQ